MFRCDNSGVVFRLLVWTLLFVVAVVGDVKSAVKSSVDDPSTVFNSSKEEAHPSTRRTLTTGIVSNRTTASLELSSTWASVAATAAEPELTSDQDNDDWPSNSTVDNGRVSFNKSSDAENASKSETPSIISRPTLLLTTSRTMSVKDNARTTVTSSPMTTTTRETSSLSVTSAPRSTVTSNDNVRGALPASTAEFGDDFDMDFDATSQPEPTNPVIYFDFRRQCPEESAGDVWWNRTYGGVIAVRYCPFGYTGKVYRMCYYGGTWGDVDFSECRVQHLIKLKHLLFYHVHKNLTDGFHSLADELLSILLRYRLRSVDDYVESLDSLNIIINARVSLDFNLGQDFKYLKAILKISDILLSKFDNRWQFPQDQQDMVTMKLVQILHGMTHFGTLVAEGIKKSSRSLVVYTDFPHIGLEAKVIRGDEDYRISPPDTGSSIHLPARMYRVSGSVDKYVVVTMWYSGITSSLQEEGGHVNSAIFATSIHPGHDLHLFSGPITVTLQISEKVSNNDLAECGFLQRTFNRSSLWSRAGCTVSQVSATSVTCICHHMTNIAVVIRPKHHQGHAHWRPVSVIVFIGCAISLTALLLTFVAHVQMLRRESSESSLIVVNLIFAMMTAEVVFMGGIQATSNAEVCEGVSIVLHYVYLVSSFWLLSNGIHVYVKIRSGSESTSGGHMKDYCLLSWIVPVVLVVLTFAVNPRGYEIRKYCWLSIERGMLISYIVPIFCLITVNTTLMVLVLKHLFETQVCMKKVDIDRARMSVRASVILLPFHGVHWFFGVLAMEDRSTDVFQTIFGFTTAVQGLLIFLFYGFLHDEIRKILSQLTSKVLRRPRSSDLKLRRCRRRVVKLDIEPLLVVHESVIGGLQEHQLSSGLAARCLHGSEEPFIMSEEQSPVS